MNKMVCTSVIIYSWKNAGMDFRRTFLKFVLIAFSSFILFTMSSCNSENVITNKANSVIESHKNKEISNFQMLLELGTLFHQYPNHEMVKYEYLNRMIISGYGSAVLHYYLSDPENRILDDKDPSVILFALDHGMQYHLAYRFLPYMTKNEFKKELNIIAQQADTLQYLNQQVRESKSSDALARRSAFFATTEEQHIAAWDRNKSLENDPCNNTALFQQALLFFDEGKTRQIIQMMKRCQTPHGQSEQEATWKNVFLHVAQKAEEIKNSGKERKLQLFELANIYASNGFADIGLRKSGTLIDEEPSNPDYLAMHAFVYYQMGDKQNALRYINEEEEITQKRSRLRSLIEDL